METKNKHQEILEENIKLVIENSKKLPKNIIYKESFNFEKLKEESKKDLTIDEENISNVQSKSPVKVHRYLDILTDFIKKRNHYIKHETALRRLKYEYYRRFYKFTMDKKQEIDIFINGDFDMLNIKDKITECDMIISYLNIVIDEFKTMSFKCNNIIEWKKYINGG